MMKPDIHIVNATASSERNALALMAAAWLINAEPHTRVKVSIQPATDDETLVLGVNCLLLLQQLGIDLAVLGGHFSYGWVIDTDNGQPTKSIGSSSSLPRFFGAPLHQFTAESSERLPKLKFANQLMQRAGPLQQPVISRESASIWSSVDPMLVVPAAKFVQLLSTRLKTLAARFGYDEVAGVSLNAATTVVDVSLLPDSVMATPVTTLKPQLQLSRHDRSVCTAGAAADKVTLTHDGYDITRAGGNERCCYRTTLVEQPERVWTAGVLRVGQAGGCCVGPLFVESEMILAELSLWRSFRGDRAMMSVLSEACNRQLMNLRNYFSSFAKLPLSASLQTPLGLQLRTFFSATGELPTMENCPIAMDSWMSVLADGVGFNGPQSPEAALVPDAAIGKVLTNIETHIARQFS
ncbi:hypothetical protein [uncultured Umboniibacter sp.]|uniref:hypothetical protein n=1 Tax=uncultured Umboniibacter sp. TaxID=1798917 RepID=UPI0026103F81|nr:hypothetical protein [uncultured Umboniibacter sp.]